MRVRIEYLDQNEQFTSCLPVSGHVGRELADEGGHRWWVVTLDEPLEYQREIGDTREYQLVTTSQLAVGSRWQGLEIGGPEPTSVHILVPLEPDAVGQTVLQPDAFDHVAWGMCYVEHEA